MVYKKENKKMNTSRMSSAKNPKINDSIFIYSILILKFHIVKSFYNLIIFINLISLIENITQVSSSKIILISYPKLVSLVEKLTP